LQLNKTSKFCTSTKALGCFFMEKTDDGSSKKIINPAGSGGW
jgi:hypothetical protein